MGQLVKSIIKNCLYFAAHLAVVPLLIVHWLKLPLFGKDRALEGSTQLLALWPGVSGQYVRRAFLSWTVTYCHRTASIGFGTIFSKTDLWVGEHVYIGPFCSFGNVRIERDTLIATGVHIPSGSKMHGIARTDLPIRQQPGEFKRVIIGEDCWIGNGAIIMADVGAHTVIGAGSVVTKSIPPLVIAAGVPATVIRERERMIN